MADVIGVLAQANVTLPSTWNNIDGYTKEVLIRGYSSAWTAMSELIARYTPYPSTAATIPITMSRAFVDRRRVWAWFSLQAMAFAGGVVFLVHLRMRREYPIADPLLYGLMSNVEMSGASRSWPDDFRGKFVKREGEAFKVI